jgi:hypothetical protein
MLATFRVAQPNPDSLIQNASIAAAACAVYGVTALMCGVIPLARVKAALAGRRGASQIVSARSTC